MNQQQDLDDLAEYADLLAYVREACDVLRAISAERMARGW